MDLRMVSRVLAPQLVCSDLYSAGDSPFFLGVMTMRVVLVFFFFFLYVYYYLHIACFNALSLRRFLLFLSFFFCKCVRVRYLFFFQE